MTDTKVIDILLKDGRAVGVKTISGAYTADAVILAQAVHLILVRVVTAVVLN